MKTPRTPPDTSAAKALRAALALRYQWPEWLLAEEITLGLRRIDAVAVRVWGGGKLGYRTLGFEIKVSRADWLRELKDWEKQRAATAAVDQFWIVATKDVVQDGELPRGWGLLEIAGSALRLKVQPAEPTTAAETLPRELLARLAGKLHDRERRMDSDERSRIQAEMLPHLQAQLAREHETTIEKAERYDALMAELEINARSSNYHDPAEWLRRARRVGEALKSAPNSWQLERAGTDLTRLAAQIAEHAREVTEALSTWQALTAAAEGRAPTTEPELTT
jgi:hypothetical protein